MEVCQIKQLKGTYNSTIEISKISSSNGYTVTLNDNGKLTSIYYKHNHLMDGQILEVER